MSKISPEIAERLATSIKELRLNKSEFASRLGISPSAIHEIISQRQSTLSELFIRSLHREFQISPDWLLHGRGEMFDSQMLRTDNLSEVQLIHSYRKLNRQNKKLLSEFIDFLADKEGKGKKTPDTISDL